MQLYQVIICGYKYLVFATSPEDAQSKAFIEWEEYINSRQSDTK